MERSKFLPALIFTFLLLGLSLAPSANASVDETIVENASGVHVVSSVLRKITESSIFPEDFNLLNRLAYVQTNFGEDESQGGIWGLSESLFNYTILSATTAMVSGINSSFGIQWKTLIYADSRIPLVSGLAASIHLALNRGSRLLQTSRDQADFLLQFDLIQNASIFVDLVEELEAGIACRSPFDLTVLLGGSAHNASNFEETTGLEKAFTAGLFGSFLKDSSDKLARFGLIALRGEDMETRLSLINPYSDYEIQRIVQDTGFSSESSLELTRINEEIKVAVGMINETHRPSHIMPVPRLLLTFSNRESSEDGGVSNIAFARQLNLRTFAVTIGPPSSQTHEQELMNLAEQRQRNLWRTDVASLPELYRQFSREICHQHLVVETNRPYGGYLALNEKRYHYFSTSDSWDYMLYLNSDAGSNLTAYISYSVEYPSSAIHDFSLPVTGEENYLPHAPPGTSRTYITIQNTGSKDLSYYNLVSQYIRPTTTTTQKPTTTTTMKPKTTPFPYSTSEIISTTSENSGDRVQMELSFALGLCIIYST